MNKIRYKVALVNPPFSKLVYGEEYSIKSITPCLGLFYLESYCQGIADFEIFEGEFYPNMADLIQEINEFEPDILAVTTNTSTFPLCVQLAVEIKAKYKIAGGTYSSYRIGESLKHFDIVFIGDAEVGFRDLLLNKPIDQVRGIAFRNKFGDIIRTSAAPLISLDEIPFPNHGKMQIGLYQASPHREMQPPFATMMTTRGCGFKCTFCLSANGGMNGGRYRERSIENVIEEVKILTEKYGVKSIQFWDDTFTMNKERTKDLCKELARFKITYVCNTRTDKMDDEIAKWLYNSGCRGVFFGIESGDQEILENNISKGVRNEQVVKAIKCCKEVKLQSTASFIFGSINDTTDSINKSIEFALKIDADFVLFNIYTAHPGTSGYMRALTDRVIDEYKVDINRYKGEPVGIPSVCKNLSREQLQILKAEAYIRYYNMKDPIFYKSIIDTYTKEQKKLKALITT